uniref:Uncharacterized protein n=1 Tax=Brassica campestris TaxID=3711 RepID=M4D0Y8_BRACM
MPSRRNKAKPPTKQWQVRATLSSFEPPDKTAFPLVGESSGFSLGEKKTDTENMAYPPNGSEEDISLELEHDSSNIYSAESDGYHDDHLNFTTIILRISKKRNRGLKPSHK